MRVGFPLISKMIERKNVSVVAEILKINTFKFGAYNRTYHIILSNHKSLLTHRPKVKSGRRLNPSPILEHNAICKS